MGTALGYVGLAETVNGPIPKPVDFAYIWGDAIGELDRMAPDVRIINLETSVTTSTDWAAKGINYRMNPDNIPCLTSAKIDCCALANNHVLDWGLAGLTETLETLTKTNLKYAGAGRNLEEAQAPAVMEVDERARVIVLSLGSQSSGIPGDWAASDTKPGVNLLKDLSEKTVRHIAGQVRNLKRRGDIVVASIHWGGNWGYDIPEAETGFAHRLIDEAGIDVIHGHSSHHVKGIEIYNQKPILYGCGDFLNDYEGIGGYEEFRDDLSLMYFVDMNPSTGRLLRLTMAPMQIRRFRLNRATAEDALWLKDTLNREGKRFGTRVELQDGNLLLGWERGTARPPGME